MKLRRSKKFAKEELFSLKRLNGKTYKYCKNFNCGNDYLNQYAIDTSTDITDAVSFMYVDNKTNKAACIYSFLVQVLYITVATTYLLFLRLK